MEGILRPRPHDPDSEGNNPGCLPGFLDKKSPPHVRGPVALEFPMRITCSRRSWKGQTVPEPPASRSGHFAGRKKEKPEPRVERNKTIWFVSERPFSRKTEASGGGLC